jgi:hydroxymethylglutaryl-CoA lyase
MAAAAARTRWRACATRTSFATRTTVIRFTHGHAFDGGLPPQPPVLPLNRAVLPLAVKIVEVGPRDGLQNEKGVIGTGVKIELVNRLTAAGLTSVEAGSMVSRAWVPAMADSADVLRGVERRAGSRLSVLTPNMKGLEAAIEAGADEVAVFGAASDAFSLRNINCNVMDSLARFRPVVAAARARGLPVRGYVSCVVGCPYTGAVHPSAVAAVAAALRDMGCYEISLGDTIGVGTPWSVRRMLAAVVSEGGVPVSALALHAHDTYGAGLANVAAALDAGVSVIDASVAGLGGCPYAGGGASGNVATEDVVYLLEGMGLATGVDMDALAAAGKFITDKLGVQNRSKAGAARLRRMDAAAAAAAADAAGATSGTEKERAGKRSAAAVGLAWPERPTQRAEDEWADAERAREQAAQQADFLHAAHAGGADAAARSSAEAYDRVRADDAAAGAARVAAEEDARR